MIPQTAATPVADYLDGLGGHTAALVIALRGEELRVVGRRGSFGELSLGSLSNSGSWLIRSVRSAMDR